MSKTIRAVAIGMCVIAAVLGAASYVLNRVAYGIPAFFVWKAMSGLARGGGYAELNGVRLYYQTYGRGPPVLVLHGGLGFIETMHYQIRALARDHLVVAPDSRAHG